MPAFAYQAVDPAGKRVRGRAEAATPELLLRSLSDRGVVVLKVEDAEVLRRLGSRWICPNSDCNATYHLSTKPPRTPGICDLCGTKLIQREDDKEETVRRRLEIYRQNIVELIPHYQRQGLVREVPGVGEIDKIYNNIVQVLPVASG